MSEHSRPTQTTPEAARPQVDLSDAERALNELMGRPSVPTAEAEAPAPEKPRHDQDQGDVGLGLFDKPEMSSPSSEFDSEKAVAAHLDSLEDKEFLEFAADTEAVRRLSKENHRAFREREKRLLAQDSDRKKAGVAANIVNNHAEKRPGKLMGLVKSLGKTAANRHASRDRTPIVDLPARKTAAPTAVESSKEEPKTSEALTPKRENETSTSPKVKRFNANGDAIKPEDDVYAKDDEKARGPVENTDGATRTKDKPAKKDEAKVAPGTSGETAPDSNPTRREKAGAWLSEKVKKLPGYSSVELSVHNAVENKKWREEQLDQAYAEDMAISDVPLGDKAPIPDLLPELKDMSTYDAESYLYNKMQSDEWDTLTEDQKDAYRLAQSKLANDKKLAYDAVVAAEARMRWAAEAVPEPTRIDKLADKLNSVVSSVADRKNGRKKQADTENNSETPETPEEEAGSSDDNQAGSSKIKALKDDIIARVIIAKYDLPGLVGKGVEMVGKGASSTAKMITKLPASFGLSEPAPTSSDPNKRQLTNRGKAAVMAGSAALLFVAATAAKMMGAEGGGGHSQAAAESATQYPDTSMGTTTVVPTETTTVPVPKPGSVFDTSSSVPSTTATESGIFPPRTTSATEAAPVVPSTSSTSAVPTPTEVVPPTVTPPKVSPDMPIGNPDTTNKGLETVAEYSDSIGNLENGDSIWKDSMDLWTESGVSPDDPNLQPLTNELKNWRLSEMGISSADAVNLQPGTRLPMPSAEVIEEIRKRVLKS